MYHVQIYHVLMYHVQIYRLDPDVLLCDVLRYLRTAVHIQSRKRVLDHAHFVRLPPTSQLELECSLSLNTVYVWTGL